MDSLKKPLQFLHLFMCHSFCSCMKRCFENRRHGKVTYWYSTCLAVCVLCSCDTSGLKVLLSRLFPSPTVTSTSFLIGFSM